MGLVFQKWKPGKTLFKGNQNDSEVFISFALAKLIMENLRNFLGYDNL